MPSYESLARQSGENYVADSNKREVAKSQFGQVTSRMPQLRLVLLSRLAARRFYIMV